MRCASQWRQYNFSETKVLGDIRMDPGLSTNLRVLRMATLSSCPLHRLGDVEDTQSGV